MTLERTRAHGAGPRPSIACTGLVVGITLCGLAAPTRAQPVETSTTAPVEVEAPAPLPETPDPTAQVTQVPAARLARARARQEGLARVVDQVAGARVLDLGGPGGQQQLTVRGGASSQALVVIDGIPLRMPFASGFDLGLLPLQALSRVELARGGQGASWGDGALTGALVLRTRAADGAPYQAVGLGLGSFRTARASLALGMDGFDVAGTYDRTSGDFGYVSSLVGLPPEDRERDNNDSERGTLTVGAQGEGFGGRWSARIAGAIRDAGVPGLADTPGESRVARERTRHLRGHLAWRRPLAWADGGELRVVGHAAALDLDYVDPAEDDRAAVDFVSTGADVDLTLGLAERHLLRGVVSAGAEVVRGDTRAARHRFAVGVSDEWDLDAVLVFGAVRAESVGGQSVAVLPRLGARWLVHDDLSLTLAAGRSFRAPTLDELFHPQEVAFVGNPDLVAERAWEAELSARFERAWVQVGLTGFVRRISEPILYINRNAFLIRPENLGAARAAGGEAEMALAGRWGDWRASGQAQVSLLASELEATGARLPTQPVWSFATDASVGYRAVSLDTGVRGFGPTFVNLQPSPENRVPTYVRWDAGVRATLGRHVTLGVEVQNLLDRRTLQSVNRFPLPGRTVFASLRVASAEDA